MLTSAFIDFSDQISGTRSILDLNKQNQNRRINAENMGFSPEMLAIPDQVHSSKIICIDEPGYYMDTDGLITENPDIILTLKVADCVPVYLSSPQIIGLVHSGWRGTACGVVSNAIRKILSMGANGKDVSAFLGPAIGFCCYEIDGEVAGNFHNKAKRKMENGKWKLGLHEEICLQLTELGIPSTNIKTSDICTFESLDCHSYRRDGPKAGCMFAFIEMQS